MASNMASNALATNSVIEKLLNSEEPSIRWKTRVHVVGEDPSAASIQKLQDDIVDGTDLAMDKT